MGKRRSTGEFGQRLLSREGASPEIVKSAQRTMEILEFFDDYGREASVMQVAEALGYPQSSTTALLKSLASLGYLQFNSIKRTYFITVRVSLLGGGISAEIACGGRLIDLLHELRDEFGHSIALISRNGMNVQYIHILRSPDAQPCRVGIGHLRPLLHSGAGMAMASRLLDLDIQRLVMRTNAEALDGKLLRYPEIMMEIAEIRRLGYSVRYGPDGLNSGLVSVPLAVSKGSTPLALGVFGSKAVITDRCAMIGNRLSEAAFAFTQEMYRRAA